MADGITMWDLPPVAEIGAGEARLPIAISAAASGSLTLTVLRAWVVAGHKPAAADIDGATETGLALLTAADAEAARAAIGAGTSSFSGSYQDLADKPGDGALDEGLAWGLILAGA